MTRRTVAALVALLLVALLVQELAMIRGQSLTFDEGADFYAGYAIWTRHDYGLNAAHPPLVKLLATIPLLDLPLRAPPPPTRHLQADMCGREFLFGNGPGYSADALIWRGRLVAGLFGLVLALLTFLAGREMFGVRVGILSLALLVFDPNVLAHGLYMTTDTALSCLMFATVFALYRYVKAPTLTRLVLAGAAAGLALATKHSAMVLAPTLLLLLFGALPGPWSPATERPPVGRWFLRRTAVAVAMAAVALAVLWACYGFRYAARPAGWVLEPTLAQQLGSAPHLQARAVALAAKLHALPEAWLSGLLDVERIARSVPAYLFGSFYPRGLWFYFPVLFSIKLTLGLIGLLALAVWSGITRALRVTREVWFLALPAVLFLLVAMGSHLNQGIRHVLPLWPFVCILVAAGICRLIDRNRRWIWPSAALLVLHVTSSALAYPNYLAYSNEAWGGPSQTYHYVVDSNVDWGQQLRATRDYLQKRGVKECWFAYVVAPLVLPEFYGVPCRRLPTAASIYADEQLAVPPRIRGPVLVSVGELYGLDYEADVLNPYVGFRTLTPSALIQDGVLVFDGEFAVPQLSALSHIHTSAALVQAGRFDAAVGEANAAQALTPGEFRAELALGDALAAKGVLRDAVPHYVRALAQAVSMDGSGRRVWVPVVQKRLTQAGHGTPAALVGGGPRSCLQ